MIKNKIGSIPKTDKEKLARLQHELKNQSQQVAKNEKGNNLLDEDEKKIMRQLSKGK
jgi:hypothetical protein